ncbi:MAG: polymerase, sigma-24 subunit, subfamily [Capsulimonas sp.]|nr:polymerase, sigma-24 subunit, subfamily [Capsulimonas sp.]
MMDDSALLRRFQEEKSEAAFAALVQRHRQFVFRVCLREVGDSALAEDVSQAVFLILLRKSNSIKPGAPLSGWLFSTARFASRNALRMQARQRRREEEAEAMRHNDSAGNGDLTDLLTDALASLRAADRDLLILKYYEGSTSAELARRMDISEAAVRTRISRALDRMRRWCAAHGAPTTVIILAAMLADEWKADAAPSSPTLPASPIHPRRLVSSEEIFQGALRAMQIQRFKTTLVATLAAAGMATGIAAGINVPAPTATQVNAKTASMASEPQASAAAKPAPDLITYRLVTIETAKFAPLRAAYLKDGDSSRQNGGAPPSKSAATQTTPATVKLSSLSSVALTATSPSTQNNSGAPNSANQANENSSIAPDATALYKAVMQNSGTLLSSPSIMVAPGNEAAMQLANNDGAISLTNRPSIPASSSETITTWKFHFELSPAFLQATGAPIKTDFTLRIPNKQAALVLETPLREADGTQKKSLVIFAYAYPLIPDDKPSVSPFEK